jgi:hypothetical protein
MGAVGYFVKLSMPSLTQLCTPLNKLTPTPSFPVHVPLNNILVGGA